MAFLFLLYATALKEIYQLKQANGTWEKHTVSTNNSDPITSTSELLLKQNSVTAHTHQS
jgi:hypothetical protein